MSDARDTNTCLVYVTAADRKEAGRIARAMVEERLAACANILGAIQSVYRWEGEVCESEETALLLKTTDARKNNLIHRIRQLHSYDCPCIVCLPVIDGHPCFLQWIADQTGE